MIEPWEQALLDREHEEQKRAEYAEKYSRCHDCDFWFTDEGFKDGYGMCRLDMEYGNYYSFEEWSGCKEYSGPMIYPEPQYEKEDDDE